MTATPSDSAPRYAVEHPSDPLETHVLVDHRTDARVRPHGIVRGDETAPAQDAVQLGPGHGCPALSDRRAVRASVS